MTTVKRLDGRACDVMCRVSDLLDEHGGEGVVDDGDLLDPREVGRGRASLVEQPGEEDHRRRHHGHWHTHREERASGVK